jgi:hypothetical protein
MRIMAIKCHTKKKPRKTKQPVAPLPPPPPPNNYTPFMPHPILPTNMFSPTNNVSNTMVLPPRPMFFHHLSPHGLISLVHPPNQPNTISQFVIAPPSINNNPKSAMLKSCKIIIHGTDFSKTHNQIIDAIKEHGGISEIDQDASSATHVIATENSFDTIPEQLKQKAVNEQWLWDSIDAGQVKQQNQYSFSQEPALKKIRLMDTEQSLLIDEQPLLIDDKPPLTDNQPLFIDDQQPQIEQVPSPVLALDDNTDELMDEPTEPPATPPQQPPDELDYEDKDVITWTKENVQDWLGKNLNIPDDQSARMVMQWILKEKIDGQVLLELDDMNLLKYTGFALGIRLKLAKLVGLLKH